MPEPKVIDLSKREKIDVPQNVKKNVIDSRTFSGSDINPGNRIHFEWDRSQWNEYILNPDPSKSYDELLKEKASNQSWSEKATNSLVQLGGGFVGQTIEGIGYLLDAQFYHGLLTDSEQYTGNIISQLGQNIKETSEEVAPIHQRSHGKFDPGDAGWWFKNGANTISSLAGLIVPARGASSLASRLARFSTAGRISKASQATKITTKGIFEATVSRQMESMMEANNIYKDTYAELTNQGIDSNKAKEIASEAAATVYRGNWVMLLQDIPQYIALRTSYNPFNRGNVGIIANAVNKGKLTNAQAKLLDVTANFFSEAGEEAYQFVLGEEGKYMANKNAGLTKDSSFFHRLHEYSKSGELWTSAFFGGLGGGGMQLASNISNPILNRKAYVQKKALTNAQKEFIDKNYGKNITNLKNIAIADQSGNEELSIQARKVASLNKTIEALELDLINGNEKAFNNHIQSLESIQNENPEKLQELGFEDNESLQSLIPKFINDANRARDLYIQFSKNNSPDVVGTLVYNTLLQEKYDSQLKESQVRAKALEASVPDIANLSVEGKEFFNEALAINKLQELEKQLTAELKLENITEETKESHRNKIKAIQEQIKDIEANTPTLVEAIPENEREKDMSIISQIPDLVDLTKQVTKQERLEYEIDRIRKSNQLLRDKNFQGSNRKEKIARQLETVSTPEELTQFETAVAPYLDDNLKQAIKEKKLELKLNQRIETETLSKDPVNKQAANNIINTANNISGPQLNEKEKEINDNDIFEPDIESSELDSNQLQAVADDVKNYFDSLSLKLNKQPSFEEFIRDFINITDKEQTDKVFNLLKDGWASNNFPTADFDAVYDRVFDSRKSYADRILQTRKTIKQSVDNIDRSNRETVGTDADNQPIHSTYTTDKSELKLSFINTNRKPEVKIVDGQTIIDYSGEGLNSGTYTNSLLLTNPDKYHKGTILDVEIPSFYEEVPITVRDTKGNKIEVIPFGQYLTKYNITPNSQEYWDNIPMIVKDEEENLAFIHSPSWYEDITKFRSNDTGSNKEEAINTLRDLRNALKDNSRIKIEITSKSLGKLGPMKSREKVSINEANPNSILFAIDDSGQVSNSGQTLRLTNKEPLSSGQLYQARRASIDENGNPTYIAIEADSSRISNEVVETISNAIDIYLNQDTKGADQVRMFNSLDISNIRDLESFIQSYIKIFQPGKLPKTDVKKEIVRRANSRLKSGLPFVTTQSGALVFGISGQNITDDKLYISIHPNDPPAEKERNLAIVKSHILPEFFNNHSNKLMKGDYPVVFINKQGAYIKNESYNNYLKDTFITDLMSINIGTEENPIYSTYVQPVITYKRADVEDIQIEDSTVDINTEIEESDIDKFIRESQEGIEWINGTDIDFEPEALSEQAYEAIAANIQRVPGLSPLYHYYVSNYLFNQAILQFKDGISSISKKDIRNNLKEGYDSYVNSVKEEYQARMNRLADIYNNEPEKFPKLPKLISDHERAIKLADFTQKHFKTLFEDAYNKVKRYTTLKEVDTNEVERDFSVTSLQLDPKDTSSHRLKRFLAGVQDVRLDSNKNKKPVTSLFNIPVYVPFKEIFDTVGIIVADGLSTYDYMINNLKDYQLKYPWIENLINNLDNADEQLRNEFVVQMTKHSMNMKFGMFSYNKKNDSYSLKVYNTNSSQLVNSIIKEWKSDFKTSSLVTTNNGKYQISKERAKYLSSMFNSWTKIPDRLPSRIRPLFISNLKPGIKTISKDIKLPLNKDFLLEVNNTAFTVRRISDTKFDVNRFDTNNAVQRLIAGDRNPTTISKGVSELNDWLKDFGISLHRDSIETLITRGFNHGKAKRKPFNELFEKSRNTSGVFGLLAQKLDDYQTFNILDIEETAVDPFNEGAIRHLAKLDSKFNLHNSVTSFRDGQKNIYAFTQHKFATERTNELKSDEDLRKVLLSKDFNKHSMILGLLDSDPIFREKFELFHMGITAFKELGTRNYRDNTWSSLSRVDNELATLSFFEDMTQGSVESNLKEDIKLRIAHMMFPNLSDKSTQVGLKTAVLDLEKKHLMENDQIKFSQAVLDLLYTQLVKPDLERILSTSETTIKNYDRGKDLFYFIPALNSIQVDGENLIEMIKVDNTQWSIDKIEQDFLPQIMSVIESSIKQLAADRKKLWQEHFVEKDKIKYLDNTYLNKFSNATMEEKLDLATLDFEINSLISTANIMMMFNLNPAVYYKKAESTANTDYNGIVRDTFDNIGKRLGGLIGPGNKLAESENNKYLQIFINDRETKAQELDYLQRILTNSSGYTSIEASDAQEYTTWREHLYVLEKLGRTPGYANSITSEELQEISNIIEKETPIENLSDRQRHTFEKVLQPLKPQYFGDSNDGDVLRQVYIKTSSFPLIPQLTKGLEIDKLRVALENLETNDPQGRTVRASFNTGNKVGALSNSLDLFDKEGNINLPEDLNPYTLELERKYFRIQQDIPFKSLFSIEKISFGTQMGKLLFGDNVRQELGNELYDKYNETFDNLINLKKEKLLKELGVKKGQEIDIQKLQDILIREASERGYPKQDIEALGLTHEYDNQGNIIGVQFNLPIWASPNSNRYESLLNAIISNRLAKFKFPGYSYVVGSEEGFTGEAIPGNKIIWTNKWEGYLRGARQEGETFKQNQVLVPAKFRDNEGNLIDLFSKSNGEYVYITEENGVFKLKEDAIDSDLLSMTTFRIPTSGHVSMSQVEIVGFLPYTSGDLMIVPKHFTKQKGLDFDVDKEQAYFLHHYLDGNTIKVIDDNYITKTLDNKLDQESDTATENLLASIFGDIDSKNYTKEDIDELLNIGIKEKFAENELIKIHKQVLTHPKVQSKIGKELSIDYAKEQADKIDNITSQENNNFIAISDAYQKEKLRIAGAGKIGTGAYSLDVVAHSLFQQNYSNLNLTKDNNPINITLGNYTSDGYLGKESTLYGDRTISEALVERQNIAVDNEKEQVMGKVNLNRLTLDADKAMVMLGFDKDELGNSTAFMLLSQPIIKEYVQEMQNVRSNIKDFNKNAEQDVLDNLREKYSIDIDLTKDFGDKLTGATLLENLTNPDNLIQQVVLKKFLEFKEYGENIRFIQTSINVDSAGIGKSLFDTIERINNIESLTKSSVKNADKLIGDFKKINELDATEIVTLEDQGYIALDSYMVKPETHIGSIAINSLSLSKNLWLKQFPYLQPIVNDIFTEVVDLTKTTDEELSYAKKVETRQHIFKNMVSYMFSNPNQAMIGGPVQQERYRLFIDEENTNKQSLASYLRDLPDTSITRNYIKKNPLINKFTYDINTNGLPSLIKFNNSAAEEFDEEYLYLALPMLMKEDKILPDFNGQSYSTRKLAQDLISYAYLEGGQQEAIQFVKYIPVEYLNQSGFSYTFRRLAELGFRKAGGTDIFGSNSEGLSDFTIQYIQHYPYKAFNIPEDLIQKIGSKDSFPSSLIENQPQLVSFRDNEKPKGFNKYKLFMLNPITDMYEQIPVLGVFGMKEWNTKENLYSSIVNNPNSVKKNISSKTIKPTQTKKEEKANPFNMYSRNIKTILSNIRDNSKLAEEHISLLAGELIPFIKNNTEVKIGPFKRGGLGAFRRSDGNIYINSNKLSDNKKAANTFVHEVIHSLTVNEILKYVTEEGTYITNDPPNYVSSLVRLFKEFNKEYSQEIQKFKEKYYDPETGTFKKNRPKIDSEFEREVIYPGTKITEFITGIMTKPMLIEELKEKQYKSTKQNFYDRFISIVKDMLKHLGINIPENSALAEGISAIFELIETEQTTEVKSNEQKAIDALQAPDNSNDSNLEAPDKNQTDNTPPDVILEPEIWTESSEDIDINCTL